MRTTYRRRAFVYMAGCAVAFILAAVSCLNSSPVAGIMEKRTDLAANTVITENGQSMYQSEVLFGPFELKKGDALYNAQVSVNESVQKLSLEWQSFRLLLVPGDRLLKAANGRMTPAALRDVFDEVDALTEPVECYAMSGDFWDEEGTTMRVTGTRATFPLTTILCLKSREAITRTSSLPARSPAPRRRSR